MKCIIDIKSRQRIKFAQVTDKMRMKHIFASLKGQFAAQGNGDISPRGKLPKPSFSLRYAKVF